MFAVPKPLKFLRPHFASLVEYYKAMKGGPNKLVLADILSCLSMTMAEEGSRE